MVLILVGVDGTVVELQAMNMHNIVSIALPRMKLRNTFRRCLYPNRKTPNPTGINARYSDWLLLSGLPWFDSSAVLVPDVVTFIVVVDASEPLSVTVAGLNEQAASPGRPLQVKPIALLNPPTGVSVNVYAAD